MKGTEVKIGSFVTQFQSAVIAEPREGSLNHVARLAQTASVWAASESQQADDHHANYFLDDPLEAVPAITLQHLGLGALRTVLVAQVRKFLEHRLYQFLVSLVGRAGLDHKRNPISIADNMAFAAIFPTIRGVWASVVSAIQR